MGNTILIGAQWGDEGKGKVIDVLSRDVDVVVRYQGGNNAGHTVEIGDERYILHLIPSGILHAEKTCIIGHGVVIDPLALRKEIEGLRERNIDAAGRLLISDRAHVVFPFHRELDSARERKSGKGDKIGTTKRGIGPTYGDKASRRGLRMSDLVDEKVFPDLLADRMEEQNRILLALGADALDYDTVLAEYREVAAFLAPFVTDTISWLGEATREGKSVLFEGAQGTMLDIDYGTYPYVTSSSATAGGACTGTGMPPNRIDRVIGVIKAYTTRVGEGPFPTELTDEVGEHLAKVGNEFGATTGRPRRCGWFDGVVARYSAMVNGVDGWAFTKLDVLDELETIKVCVAYECEGQRYESVPSNIRILERCTPIYEEVPGWQASTRDARSYDELPQKARDYLDYLTKLTGVPADIVSTGPGRENTLEVSR